MKFMIASDLHGSAYYCKKLLEAFERENADKLLLLGDILYHGPRNALPKEYDPKAVSEMLNAAKDKILCVRGNCDSDVDQMVLDFSIMATYCIMPIGKRMLFATHGHEFNKENVPSITKGDILLCGHFHVPACEDTGEFIYMNPGSVSIPKEESPHSYMTLEDGCFVWKDIDGEKYMEKIFE